MVRLDESTRAQFHARLDYLIDEITRLEGDGAATPHALSSYLRGGRILSGGLAFLRDLMGEELLSEALDRPVANPTDQRNQVRHWIGSIYPLLKRTLFSPCMDRLSPFDVMDALSALGAGEIRPIFLAQTGKNRRPNRWTLSRRKLEALVWEKRLLALGHPEKRARYQITVAFGEQWDTIRKWKSQCERILGEPHVVVALANAGGPTDRYVGARRGLFGARRLNAEQSLSTDGELYRQELRKATEVRASIFPQPDG